MALGGIARRLPVLYSTRSSPRPVCVSVELIRKPYVSERPPGDVSRKAGISEGRSTSKDNYRALPCQDGEHSGARPCDCTRIYCKVSLNFPPLSKNVERSIGEGCGKGPVGFSSVGGTCPDARCRTRVESQRQAENVAGQAPAMVVNPPIFFSARGFARCMSKTVKEQVLLYNFASSTLSQRARWQVESLRGQLTVHSFAPFRNSLVTEAGFRAAA